MMYPFLTLDDQTEIVHSEMTPDGRVKVYVENDSFKHYYVDVDEILPQYVEH